MNRKTAPAGSHHNNYGNESGGEGNEDLEDLYGIDKATIAAYNRNRGS